MNSFIYKTPELLEQLLSIAQDKGTPSQALNEAALEIIRNLRTELSGLKAAANPTFTDVESLQNFKTWATTNAATAQGTPLVDSSGRFNIQVLSKFLVDLRDRFASNADFSESLANLIDQANKIGTKITLYTPAKPESMPEDPSQKPGNANVSVKINQSAIDGVMVDEKPGQQTPQQQLSTLVRSGGLSLLDGTTIDFNDVNSEAHQIRQFIGTNNNKAWSALGQVTIRITNLVGSFNSLIQAKTPGLTTVGCTPEDDGAAVENIIENMFNSGINQQSAEKNKTPRAYRYDELAEICQHFASLMAEITTFYRMLLTVPFFKTPDIEPVLQKQLEWANSYGINFRSAQQRFVGNAARANNVR